jgi:hypothetical protein
VSTGTLADLLDYVGNRVSSGITGVTAVYGATASASPDQVKPIPESFDSDITCLVWSNSSNLDAGNSETWPVQVDLLFWIVKENAATALRKAIPLIDRCRVLFRTDVSAGGNCDWFLMRGHSGPENLEMNGVTYLVLTVNTAGLLRHYSHDYTV